MNSSLRAGTVTKATIQGARGVYSPERGASFVGSWKCIGERRNADPALIDIITRQ